MEEATITCAAKEPAKNKEVRKMSYEELEGTAHQLSEQGRQLYLRNQHLEQLLQEANLSQFYKRLDYLWQVITSTTPYITEEFKYTCGNELMNLMAEVDQEIGKEAKGE